MISEEIKKFTAPLHAKVEQELVSKLFNPNLSPSEYGRILLHFHFAYLQMEHLVASGSDGNELLHDRSKLSWIKEDLESLEGDFQEVSFDHLVLDLHVDYAHSLGVSYVMEGSTLGGKFIAKKLQELDWIEKDKHLNFFLSYGDSRGEKWKDFLNLLNAYGEANPSRQTEILAASEKAFQFMHAVIKLI